MALHFSQVPADLTPGCLELRSCLLYGKSQTSRVSPALFCFGRLPWAQIATPLSFGVWPALSDCLRFDFWHPRCFAVLASTGRLHLSATVVVDGCWFAAEPPQTHWSTASFPRSHSSSRGSPVCRGSYLSRMYAHLRVFHQQGKPARGSF